MNDSSSDLNYLKSVLNISDTENFLSNYQKLADLFPSLVYIYNPGDKKAAYFNKKFTELLGFTKNDYEGFANGFTEMIFKEDEQKFHEAVEKFHDLKDDESHVFENRFNQKKGGWRYFKTCGTILQRNENGKASAILFIAQDVTEINENNLELEKTKELITETERMHQFGVFNYDALKETVKWSDGMYAIFEMERNSETQITREFFRNFIVENERGFVKEFIDEKYKKGEDFEYDCNIISAKGTVKTLKNIVKIIKDENGKTIKSIGTARDITKEKNAERELQKTIKDLNISNKELEEFAYIASHDMQEPLRKITTFSNRLFNKYKEQLDDEGKLYLERIDASAVNMRMLIENLLEISKTSRNGQAFVKTDLNEILNFAIEDLELKIEEAGATIEKQLLPFAEVIPSQIQQLFNNIIGNALKFNLPEKKTVINISCIEAEQKEKEEFLLPDKKFFKIIIRDNGIGFENEFNEKIFHIFQRLHGKAEYPGSGLGLAICKKIIEKNNGVIYAQSEPSEGSAFFIILPEKQ